MNKLEQLIMQKSKSFNFLEKQKDLNVTVVGLMFTEEDSVVNWIFFFLNRSVKDIKINIPMDFPKLKEMNYGHIFECFHNLDIDVQKLKCCITAHIFL